MFKFVDTIEEYTVEVDSSCNYLKITVELNGNIYTLIEDMFANQRIMGEYLSDRIGHGLAVELLSKNNVDKSEPIWRLSHKG